MQVKSDPQPLWRSCDFCYVIDVSAVNYSRAYLLINDDVSLTVALWSWSWWWAYNSKLWSHWPSDLLMFFCQSSERNDPGARFTKKSYDKLRKNL